MKPSAHTLRGPPASGTLSARLVHTLFVFSATSLMLIIAILSFFLTILLKSIMPAPAKPAQRRRGAERHVTFLEPSIVIKLPTPPRTPARVDTPIPTSNTASTSSSSSTATLSLTATPRELEPPTPDVAEDPLRALSRICGFLAANNARAWRREELAATPPLAGLEPYLAAVQEDLLRVEEMGEEDSGEEGDGDDHGNSEEKDAEEKEGAVMAVAGMVQAEDRQDAGADVSEDPEAGAGKVASAGAGAGVSADAHDEPGLVPAQATHATPPPPPPSQFPTKPLSPETSAATIPTSTPPPPPPTSPELPAQNTVSPEQTDTTPSTTRRPPPPPPPPTTNTTKRPPPPPPPTMTTPNPGPRKRKDAVLRSSRPTTILGPEGLVLSAAAGTDGDDPNKPPAGNAVDADKLADSDDAAVRAAALFSRVADLGAGIFEGTVRERGAALWTAFSRGRSTPSEVPVPQMPRTRFAADRG